jgi:Predicted hydrolases or acyltransferases (alpha/beta hydrolase superfamily)
MSGYLSGFEPHKIDVGDGIYIMTWIKGEGEPLLMLHGNPETHLMWHRIAPQLAEQYKVILPDLRGYGDSAHPVGDPDNANYSKRAMAQDQIKVMQHLGYDSFLLVAHDRGARVAHRMMLDYPGKVKKCVIFDIAPTYDMFAKTDKLFAKTHFHWFFLTLPYELPEKLIAGNAEYYLRWQLGEFSDKAESDRIFPEEIKHEYVRTFTSPEAIHSFCQDYSASYGIDLIHDEADRNAKNKIKEPLLIVWGETGQLGIQFDVMKLWRAQAENVTGFSVPNCGHFIPEDAPQAALQAIQEFLQA